MHQLLFARSTGDLGAQAFSRIQTSKLLGSIQSCPRVRFNGGEREVVVPLDDGEESSPVTSGGSKSKIWAHQSGVNALAIDVDNKV